MICDDKSIGVTEHVLTTIIPPVIRQNDMSSRNKRCRFCPFMISIVPDAHARKVKVACPKINICLKHPIRSVDKVINEAVNRSRGIDVPYAIIDRPRRHRQQGVRAVWHERRRLMSPSPSGSSYARRATPSASSPSSDSHQAANNTKRTAAVALRMYVRTAIIQPNAPAINHTISQSAYLTTPSRSPSA